MPRGTRSRTQTETEWGKDTHSHTDSWVTKKVKQVRQTSKQTRNRLRVNNNINIEWWTLFRTAIILIAEIKNWTPMVLVGRSGVSQWLGRRIGVTVGLGFTNDE